MSESMRALMNAGDGSGDLGLSDVPIPEPGADEVRIEIAYCGICGSDLRRQSGNYPKKKRVVLGHEFSGTVVAVGEDVTEFTLGDKVGYRRNWHPFPGVDGDGAFAPYMTAPATSLCHVPAGISMEEATQFETLATPLTLVKDSAELLPGERVVVTGPGPIGLFVTNVAKMEGASHITVVGTEADADVRLPVAERLGADQTRVFNDATLEEIAADPPAVWFETSGAAPAIEAAVDHVEHGGRITCSGLGTGKTELDMSRVAYQNLRIVGRWGGNESYLETAIEDVAAGTLHVSDLITHTFPLSEWREGFDTARSKVGIKVLLDPSR